MWPDFRSFHSDWWLVHMPVGYSEDTRVELRGKRQEARIRRDTDSAHGMTIVAAKPAPSKSMNRITQHRG